MTPRAARSYAFAANLAAFCACAGLAFARNINALFYHYDGSYALVDVRAQLSSGQPIFEYTNNFLQSIGNIQLLHNAKLLFYYWPIAWLADLRLAKIASGVLIAAIVFTSVYAVARLLSQSRPVAAAAAWCIGFLSAPFVSVWFFYPLIYVNPHFVPVLAIPVVAFWLIGGAGRSSNLFADAARALGLVALAFYVLAAAPDLSPVITLGTLPYIVLPIVTARSWTEQWRKVAVLTAAMILAVILRWPWYLIGLFLDTAPNLFPNDFTAVYQDASYASVMFQGSSFSWAGPLLVGSSALGALFSLRAADFQLRAAAWMVLALIVLFAAAGLVLTLVPHWILPPPIYFEVAIWPLYGVFAGVVLVRLSNVVAAQFARARYWKSNLVRPQAAVPVAALVLAVVLVFRHHPQTSDYPFPPRHSPVAEILKADIAFDSHSSFRGRVMTAIPVEPDGPDATAQQVSKAATWARMSGNDEMSVGLWFYRVPTLFEYNQFLSPLFHALLKRALQRPSLVHQRNMTILTYPDSRVLKLLGVRYVLMPRPDAALGALRATEDRAGEPWGLVELAAPNLATYSPTTVEVRGNLASTLDFVMDDRVDLARQATAQANVAGPLVPARSSALLMEGRDLHVTAESDGRTLVIVPVEFSHCLELDEAHPATGGGATLLRIDGLLTGMVFDRHVDALLSFRIGPLHNPLCRWEDYRDSKAMLR